MLRRKKENKEEIVREQREIPRDKERLRKKRQIDR